MEDNYSGSNADYNCLTEGDSEQLNVDTRWSKEYVFFTTDGGKAIQVSPKDVKRIRRQLKNWLISNGHKGAA